MGAQDAKQYLVAVVVNMYMLAYGIFNGWMEVANQNYIDRLRSHGDYSLSEIEENFLVPTYMYFIGPFIGSIFFGFIAMKFGRKTSLLYIPIPMIISCLLYVCVRYYDCFKLSLVLGGIYGGIDIIGPLYLMEVVNVRFRGAILTSLILPTFLGEMMAFGGYLFFSGYYYNTFVMWFIILLTVIATTLLYRYFPETPLWLIKKKKFEEAEESIRFYKNIRKTDEYHMKALKQEVDRLKRAAAGDDLESNQMNPVEWVDFKTKHAQKALAIGIVLVVLNVCISNGYITTHSALALTLNPMRFSMNVGRFIGSIVAFLGAYVGMHLVDRVGRKVLITVSAVATSMALTGFFVYVMIGPSYSETIVEAIPAITSLLAIFFGALGIRSLTFTIITEIMPEKTKDIGVIFCGAFYWMFFFIFQTILTGIYFARNSGGAEVFSAILCLVGAIIIHYILPETKGKSHQEIKRSF